MSKITCLYLTIFICIILIIVNLIIPKVGNYFNVKMIFIQHARVLKGNIIQSIVLLVVPIILSITIVGIRCIDNDILNNLNIILSIMIAMFFSVLSILCAFDQSKGNDKYKQLLQETFNTTIFEILLCLMLLIISFVALFIRNFDNSLVHKIVSGVIYYLTIVTVLNILMVIKRIKALFDNQQ